MQLGDRHTMECVLHVKVYRCDDGFLLVQDPGIESEKVAAFNSMLEASSALESLGNAAIYRKP